MMFKKLENEKEVNNWIKETKKYDTYILILIISSIFIFILSRIILELTIIEAILWSIYGFTIFISLYQFVECWYETEDQNIMYSSKKLNKAKHLIVLPLIILTIIVIINFGSILLPYGYK